MPSDRDQRYESVPPIPSYDEALATGGPADPNEWQIPRSPMDGRSQNETESQSLLNRNGVATSSRRPNGYRPPTVESEDEESSWSSDGEGDETAYVRREMQELEMGHPDDRSRPSLWGKRIPFSLSLPQWPSWRWRLPRLRPTIRLPSGPNESSNDTNDANARTTTTTTTTTTRLRITLPQWDKDKTRTAIIIFARVFAVVFVMGILYALFMSDLFTTMARRMNGGLRFNPEDVRMYIQNNVEDRRMKASVAHYTKYAHMAGTEGDYALAMDVESMFTRAGLDYVNIDEYYVYLNYPKAGGRAVEILGDDGKAKWAAKLEEEEVGGEAAGHQTFVFHGHSKSADVNGPLIYVNYGSRSDFKKLADSGIDTKGAIALVRYYGSQESPALKVKAAEEAGFAGCIVYSDPADDGFRLGDVAPNGRFMPADGVQRGSVALSNWVLGDPLTPGWESKKNLPRMKPEETKGLVKIPSLPLSWRDAQVLLQHLKGHGEQVPKEWAGGVPDVGEWWTGNLSSPIVRLKNDNDVVQEKGIWNVYGKIEGIEQDQKSIIIGNHRDAWSFGATEPHSGTAIMIEMARIFGSLVAKGWRPLRSIEFMSWDAAEYNMIGSTEFVERNEDLLRQNAFAYINLDSAVAGTEFHAAGSPVFRQTVYRVIDRVFDANLNATLRGLWDQHGSDLEDLGMGGDYVPFQNIVGTSALDVGFRGARFPAQSSYDNYEWVNRIGDPDFAYHVMMGQVVGLLILELADRPILPFDMLAYGNRIERYVNDLSNFCEHRGASAQSKFSLEPLKNIVNNAKDNLKAFALWEMAWESTVMGGGGYETGEMGDKRLQFNNHMADFETALLDLEQGGGMPDRPQFKHVIFGPQAWSGNKPVTFAGIRDAVEAGDWELANKMVEKTARIIRNATNMLQEWKKSVES
ncbi:PA domain-containing protein [Colletotrichum graminicola]|uniref:PA domain-containing protein n=1 Tax=Colletotrichum graminicola (strain M1.001 / M2 / FGSC 10212) TaxID=645133 RepID=E3QNT6_COLGM|nr:PA domain-containing protein [Colletotrichum graminicola M1.001]EFQ32443.1 PA domain-containing protein [Colletotrichum graminicola M1.001]WDK14584.1 PA domain-containing protein [Colletotrichum graminicola]